MSDLYGALPTGTTVLEASAGTGKTWTIAALATRYVAEGHAELSELMLATFGRAATQELRERVRERLTSTARALGKADRGDELVQHLSRCSPGELVLRRQRLRHALSQFDAATIATTHSFCQQVLDSLGMSGDHEPGVTMVESVDDLLREVVDDLYLRKFAPHGADLPQLSAREAREVAREATRDGAARLEPADADRASGAGQRVGLGIAARKELERRKRLVGVRDFDDLLVLLRDVLADPVRGEAACRRLRSRYTVVLVDEFQDTDPVQWEILRRAFHGHVALVLIGDPKQAIYAFRGAEVLSYLDAVGASEQHQTLATNWRSDQGLLRALEHLYGGAALGHPRILVRHVDPAHTTGRLAGQPPMRLRVLDRTGVGPIGRNGFPLLPPVREKVAADVAADIVRLLESAPLIDLDGAPRAVRPGDIAVLARRHRHVRAVQSALERAGVPCVVSSSTSVFATQSARDWLWLLQALEQPHRLARVRLAALTPLIGWSAERLLTAGLSGLDEVATLVRDAAARFEEAGLAAAFERLASQTQLESRLLSVQAGERQLTDLRHLAQVLNRAAVEDSLGLSALSTWLGERVEDPDSGSLSERSRRLETDAAAVQIVTVHASKGLEFPIVYVPYGWDGAKNPQQATLLLHDPDGTRVLDVGGRDGPGYAERKKVSDAEDAGEELRLLYVALTRAMCQVVVWWAPSAVTAGSPLHRLLLGRTEGDPEPAARPPVPEDAAAHARLAHWAWPDEISLEQVPKQIPPAHWDPPQEDAPELAAARFARTLDMTWRRTSYSALTSAAHDAPRVSSEPEQPERTDEPGEPPPVDVTLSGPPSTMNDLPAGAAFGTLVHEVLEDVDTSADDLSAELLLRAREAVARRLAPVDPAALAAALLPVLRTPLGEGGTLADVMPADRLAEMDFELPLSGGDSVTAVQATLRDVAALLRTTVPADDLLAPYADLLETVEAPALRGYLSGSIDAVLRLAGPSYVVVDYKTNRLARGDLTALHYTREAMAAEMLRAHYPLQALLYAVALHRFLRWRQPGYDPGVHLGGVQYLFVRGMVGPDTPPGCGVFDWNPPTSLVTGLSDLLAGSS
ncbi:MAG: exodeoxyribonuclease beta subunit [Frankiales bacterium]|nr:exodeoxyribonuclease beta subunit [Frankiales bacterium]